MATNVLLYGLCIFIVTFLHTVHGGKFLLRTFEAGSRPNNTEAVAICKQQGNYALAVIDTPEEYQRMLQYLNTTFNGNISLADDFWIGGYAEYDANGAWVRRWELCGLSMEWTFAEWNAGEPDGNGTQSCLRIHTSLTFMTFFCSGTFDVMCEEYNVEDNPQCKATSTEIEDCAMFASCWWTAARIGLCAGFTSLLTFLILLCIAWKCFCAAKNKIADDHIEFEDDDDDKRWANLPDNAAAVGYHHNTLKNYNIDHVPAPATPSTGINSIILNNGQDTSWMTPEEQSFSARYQYKE